MSIPIYIAGASGKVAVIQELQREVKLLGYEITHDWTQHIKEAYQDKLLSDEEAKNLALDDFMGVCRAQVIWLVIPPDGRSKGSWIEYGCGLTCKMIYMHTQLYMGKGNLTEEQSKQIQKNQPIVIASGDWRTTIFLHLADKTFAEHSDALLFLREFAEKFK